MTHSYDHHDTGWQMAEHVLGQCFSHFLWPLHLLPVHVHFFLQYFSLAGLP